MLMMVRWGYVASIRLLRLRLLLLVMVMLMVMVLIVLVLGRSIATGALKMLLLLMMEVVVVMLMMMNAMMMMMMWHLWIRPIAKGWLHLGTIAGDVALGATFVAITDRPSTRRWLPRLVTFNAVVASTTLRWKLWEF